MKTNKKIIETEIKVLKKTKIWSSLLKDYFNQIIEAVISKYAPDLEREETKQECWLFVIKLVPKIKLKQKEEWKADWIASYTYTCIKNHLILIRQIKAKHTMVSLEELGDVFSYD